MRVTAEVEAVRQRLDVILVARGLVATRARARDLILRGAVSVGGVVQNKCGVLVDDIAAIDVSAAAGPARVSRGAVKLEAGLAAFEFCPARRICLDIGASTGGFTEVLLERDAARVYAVDVGHGQIDDRVAGDNRVVVLEGTDARQLSRDIISDPIMAVTADVSFISVTKVLPSALALTTPGAWLVALVKPQFEVGRDGVGKGGVVRNDAVRATAVVSVRSWLERQPGWQIVGCVPSPIAGGAGNVEFLLGAERVG